jgi:magnesium chelatase subunit D
VNTTPSAAGLRDGMQIPGQDRRQGNTHDSAQDQRAARVWADAISAAALLAIDPQGLGGISVKAGAGPVRDQWLAHLRDLLPAAVPNTSALRRMPTHIADERLLGGLDLTATLARGKPVAQRGLLAESDGGLVLVAMAERLSAGTAARLCGVLDSGEVSFERDGLSSRWPARLGVVALDESTADDAPPPAALQERLAFAVDLRELGLRDLGAPHLGPLEAGLQDETLAFNSGCISNDSHDTNDINNTDTIKTARQRLSKVHVSESLTRALCGTALQLGVMSLRASLHALRATQAAAALAGRVEATEEDAQLAARLVLVPRATRRPPAEPELDDTPVQPEPPEPTAPNPPNETDPPPPPPPQPETSAEPPEPPADNTQKTPPKSIDEAMEDRLIEATVAALPAGLLAALLGAGDTATQSGRVGALTNAPRGGRPVGTRRGEPRGGARLNVIETLRAAAPWQRLRAMQAAQATRASQAPQAPQSSSTKEPTRSANPTSSTPTPVKQRLHIHADDLRISRLQQRAATATVFVIDASGSSALHRLAEAKGAINLLLADCYVRRDQVAVIAFRGKTAELLLPPTRSLVRAKRSLAGLPGGGATPLAAGLQAALLLSKQIQRSGATPIVVLLTDGRGNIALDGEPGRAKAEQDSLAMARQLRAARLTTLVVDTSPQPAPAAQKLAAELAGHYRALPYAGAKVLQAAVNSLPGRAP